MGSASQSWSSDEAGAFCEPPMSVHTHTWERVGCPVNIACEEHEVHASAADEAQTCDPRVGCNVCAACCQIWIASFNSSVCAECVEWRCDGPRTHVSEHGMCLDVPKYVSNDGVYSGDHLDEVRPTCTFVAHTCIHVHATAPDVTCQSRLTGVCMSTNMRATGGVLWLRQRFHLHADAVCHDHTGRVACSGQAHSLRRFTGARMTWCQLTGSARSTLASAATAAPAAHCFATVLLSGAYVCGHHRTQLAYLAWSYCAISVLLTGVIVSNLFIAVVRQT